MNGFFDLEENCASEKKKNTEEETNEVQQLLLKISEQELRMEQMLKNQINVKDEMIDKLHKELDYYKRDAAEKFTDQLMKAVIKIRKDMVKRILEKKWDTISVEALKQEYQYVFEDLTDLLEQQNVDPYESEPGDDFDPAIHQPKMESTSDKELDRKIKGSISEGYKKGSRVLIPERVVIYQYKEKTED